MIGTERGPPQVSRCPICYWRSPILWPPDAKSWLIWQDPDAGKDWGQEEKGTTEDEMVGWHHRVNGHGFEWTLGVGDGQGGLACCDSWGRKESDWATELNWTEWKLAVYLKSVFIKLSSLENIEAAGERWKTFICADRKKTTKNYRNW